MREFPGDAFSLQEGDCQERVLGITGCVAPSLISICNYSNVVASHVHYDNRNIPYGSKITALLPLGTISVREDIIYNNHSLYKVQAIVFCKNIVKSNSFKKKQLLF